MAQTQMAAAKIDTFKGILNSQSIRAQLKNSLRENSGAFMSSMLDLYSSDTSLQNCDPEKVALECVKAAALNLPLTKALGFAYVVPFNNKPTFIIGYKGLIQLAQRTGQYKTINSDVVYEGEIEGFDKLSGSITFTGERTSNEVIGYFAYIKMLNGFEKVLYMTKEEVEVWGKRYSPGYGSNFSPWKTEFDKMAKKTVLRQLISVYGYMSMEMQNVITSDDTSHEDKVRGEIDRNSNTIVIDETGEIIEDNRQSADLSQPTDTVEQTPTFESAPAPSF